MSVNNALAVVAGLLSLMVGCGGPMLDRPGTCGGPIEAELARAVAVAVSVVGDEGYMIDEYTLTSAERILHRGRYVWRITFKSTRLIPDDPAVDLIGAGGEVFVTVDPATQETEIRYGE